MRPMYPAREYAVAEQACGAVVRDYPDSLYFEKALYQYGWTQFKQSRWI